MQIAKPTLRSKGCLKNKFKELIQTLRNRTVLKEHITSAQKSVNLPLQSQQYLQAQINSILPITQISKTHIQQFLSNDESSSDRSSEFIKNHIQDIRTMNEIEQSLYEDNEENQEEVEGSKFLVNQLTDLLRPQERLEFPKNEGRTGCIRRQRFSVNRAKNEAKQPRYIKNPRKDPPKETAEIALNRTNIKDLDDVAVIKCWSNSKKITQNSTIQEIYETFSKLIEDLNINLSDPMIKKYKNCVYFGSKPESHTYEGIIYYFDNKMYYGQHYLGNKHGHGVEINFENNTKFAGAFNLGKKSGYFFVQRQRENYEGMIEHGIYQGEGKLMTEDYVYVGSFQNGKKHGYGEEYYPKTGLRLKGCFKNGQYQNMDKSKMVHDPTSEQQLKVKPERIMVKADSYDIDFQLQRTFKRQVQGLASSSSFNMKEDLQRTDSHSLFDMLTNSSKANKYDYNTSTRNDRLPKIRIQGIHTQFKEQNPQFSVQPVTNKKHYQLYNSRESSPIARRSRSNNQNPVNIIDRELPLTKHRLNFPIRSGK